MSIHIKPGQQIFAPVDENGDARSVSNQEVQVWSTEVERVIGLFVSSGGLIFESKASLDADLAHATNSMAWVLGDATAANNGIYQKQGASGAGSWTRLADLPYSFIIASDAGAGTPNAIIATTAIPVSESALILLNIADTNTGSPVTVAFNGGAALAIKTNSGENVSAGGLVSGMVLMGIVSGSTFRLASDEAIASLVYAARDEAEAQADRAQLIADTVAALSAGPGFVSVAEVPFSATPSEVQTPAQRRAAMQDAIDYAALAGLEVRIPLGTWTIDRDLVWHSGSRISGYDRDLTIIKLDLTADIECAGFRPNLRDSSITGCVIQNLTVDLDADFRSPTSAGTLRPGGSCVSTDGAKWVYLKNLRLKNAVLHCLDICSGGEVDGDVRYYVNPANYTGDEYPTYYPANASQFVFADDVIVDNPGDDGITTHYSRYIWINRPRCMNGSRRHSEGTGAGSGVGIEIDDGSRDVWINSPHITNFLGGIGVKAHDFNPAPQNVHINDPLIEDCHWPINCQIPYNYSHVPAEARNIWITNPHIKDCAVWAGFEAETVTAIRVLAYQGVRIVNPVIEGTGAITTGFGSAIVAGSYTLDLSIENPRIVNWQPGGSDPVIALSSSVQEWAIIGGRVLNSGGDVGLSYGGSAKFTLDGLRLQAGASIAGGAGVVLTSSPEDSRSAILGLEVSGFPVYTRIAGVERTIGQGFVPGGLTVPGVFSVGKSVVSTIAGGIIALGSSSHIRLVGEGGVADNLDRITGGSEGDIVILRAGSNSVDITVRHNQGTDGSNILLNGAANFVLDHGRDKLVLICDSAGDWCEMGRGNNFT